MQQMLPLLLDWLSTAPDPDLGLLVLRNLLDDPLRSAQVIDSFRESPEAARVGSACSSARAGRWATSCGRIRIWSSALPYAEQLVTRERRRLVASRRPPQLVGGKVPTCAPACVDGRTAISSVSQLGTCSAPARCVDVVGTDLTALAEATLEATLAVIEPQLPFAVIGMGRFGGGEMSYASDLDVLFVYEGKKASDG